MKKLLAFGLSILLLALIVVPLAMSAQGKTAEGELDSYIEREFEKTHIPAIGVFKVIHWAYTCSNLKRK